MRSNGQPQPLLFSQKNTAQNSPFTGFISFAGLLKSSYFHDQFT
jgi:hypothetical protein